MPFRTIKASEISLVPLIHRRAGVKSSGRHPRSSVTNSRPRGSGTGSSKSRFQPRSGTRAPIMRHALAAIEAPIFLRRPIALSAPCLKIRLSPFRQEHAPGRLEIGPVIKPSIRADRDRMAAVKVLAIDEDAAHAGGAHFAEGDLLRAGEVSHALLKRGTVGYAIGGEKERGGYP